MKRPAWVSSETMLLLHEQLLAAFGGASGVRDQGLLDSALARPQHRLAYVKPTLYELAASYAFGIVKNHPFVDANKRTAFTIAVLFLELNGQRFVAPEADATVQTLGLAAGAITEAQYSTWLKTSSRRAPRATD